MRLIMARNVNDAYINGLWHIKTNGKLEQTRNGTAMVCTAPVLTVYRNPTQRVLFSASRDINPFFHMAEAIWMLAGSDDAGWIADYNSNMMSYSNDGVRLNGAYGWRWRGHFGYDQILTAYETLRKDPHTRRIAIAMWDASTDLENSDDNLDIPCNTHLYLRNNDGDLDLTVCCRSNDAIWGAYGTNVVHFSMLQELLALSLGLGVGSMYQLSNNFHLYEQHLHLLNSAPTDYEYPYPYVVPMLRGNEDIHLFLEDCCHIVKNKLDWEPQIHYLRTVALPMLRAYTARKHGHSGKDELAIMPDCDWKQAANQYIDRRANGGASGG